MQKLNSAKIFFLLAALLFVVKPFLGFKCLVEFISLAV